MINFQRVIAISICIVSLFIVTGMVSGVTLNHAVVVPSSNLIARFDGYTLSVYNSSLQLLNAIPIFNSSQVNIGPHYISWSPNGQKFVLAVAQNLSGVAKDVIQLWDYATQTKLYETENIAMGGTGANLVWNNQSTQFAAIQFSGTNNNISIYEIGSNNVIVKRDLDGIFGYINHISWSGSYILAETAPGIKVWNASSGQIVGTVTEPSDNYAFPTFNGNGDEFVFVSRANPREIQVWQTYPTQFKRKSTLPLEVWGVAWGQHSIITIHADGSLRVLDPISFNILQTIQGLGYISPFISWNATKTHFLVESETGGTQIRDGLTGAISPLDSGTPVPPTFTPTPTTTSVPPTLTPSPTPSYTCTVSGIATEATLKTAITNANTLSTASVLCLQPNITITMIATPSALSNSFGDSFLPLIQRDITIVGNGSTLTRSTSAVHGRFFRVAGADAKLTLDGITLTGGIASGNSKGGAVRVDSRMVILKNNTIITGNSAEAGGAIYNYLGTVQIENSTLSNNTVGTDGGALYGIGIFTLTNTIVSENKSSNNGGGMYVFNASGTLSQVTLTDSTFLSNEATNNGGGLSLMSGVTLTLNRGFITTNWAINFGGGMALTDANATVTTTEFEGNYSTNTQSRGGAIFMTGTDAALTVNGAKFLNNTTKTSGGAIYNASGDINLTGGSFTGNQTQASGSDGGAIFSSNASAELKIQNAKFTSNSALDQGGAVTRSNGTGFMSGSCLVTNTAANGAAVFSSNSFTATNNWWNNTTPPVNSNVTTSPVTPGATCPLG